MQSLAVWPRWRATCARALRKRLYATSAAPDSPQQGNIQKTVAALPQAVAVHRVQGSRLFLCRGPTASQSGSMIRFHQIATHRG